MGSWSYIFVNMDHHFFQYLLVRSKVQECFFLLFLVIAFCIFLHIHDFLLYRCACVIEYESCLILFMLFCSILGARFKV